MRRNLALISTLVLFMLLAFVPARTPAQVSDAQLVGEWVGKWRGGLYQGTGLPPTATKRGVQDSGDYLLTITKVEGERVYGRVQQPGLSLPEYKMIGTLKQNTLSWGNERYQIQLTIEGDKMTGTQMGGPVPRQISLQKKK